MENKNLDERKKMENLAIEARQRKGWDKFDVEAEKMGKAWKRLCELRPQPGKRKRNSGLLSR